MRFITSTILSSSLLLTSAFAQTTSVPSSLSGSFEPDAIALTVGFEGSGLTNQVTDGSTLTLTEASKTPSFALSDSSGVNTAIKFLIMMVDSTDTSNLILHFLQSDFKANGDETGISSSSTPSLSYQAPGTFSESGKRQYSFLMFQQIQDSVTGIPSKGEKFDISNFQSQNDLKKGALAGLGIFVELSGSSGSSSSSTTSSSAAVSVATTTAATTTISAAGSTTSSNTVIVTFESPIIQGGTTSTSTYTSTAASATAVTTTTSQATTTASTTAGASSTSTLTSVVAASSSSSGAGASSSASSTSGTGATSMGSGSLGGMAREAVMGVVGAVVVLAWGVLI